MIQGQCLLSLYLFALVIMASMGARIAEASVPITGSISVQLTPYVESTMSEDVKDLYESTMEEFYQTNLVVVSDVTVTLMLQELEYAPATRHQRRSLQTTNAAPLNTLLLVEGIVLDNSNMTGSDFSSQLIEITAYQSAILVYLLKAADPSYFATVENVTSSSISTTDTNESNLNETTTTNEVEQLFITPSNAAVVCTDSISNVCTASTSCAAIGETNFTTGSNLYFEAVSATNGMYTITGGYTIEFPLQCNITCVGNCSCTECPEDIVLDNSTSGSTNSTLSSPIFVADLSVE